MSNINFQEFKTLAIVSVVAICGMFGTDIHLASIPHIMSYMHTDKAHMQQSVSIYLLGMGLSLLFYGPLSDKYGRKPIVIFGLSLACVASFAAAYTSHINAFLVMRLLQGIGSGVCLGVGRTILADVLQGERLATVGSYFSLFLALSPLLAPALGGYIQHWFDWQANFIVFGSLLTTALFLYTCYCPETNQHRNPQAFSVSGLYSNYKFLLFHPTFVGATLITGIVSAATMVYATSSPIIFQTQYHMSPITYGWITASAGAGGFIGKLTSPFAIRKIGSQKTLLLGLVLLVIAGLWLAFFKLMNFLTVPLIMVAVFLTIFSQAYTLPGAVSRALGPFHDKRGAAGALYGSFQMLVAFLVSAITGLLSYNGVLVLTVSYCTLGVLGMVIYWCLFQEKTLKSTLIESLLKKPN